MDNPQDSQKSYLELKTSLKGLLRSAFSKIHLYRPIYLVIAVILFIVSTVLFSEKIELFLHAKRTNGTVIEITGENEICGKNEKRKPCTKFTTTIEFRTLSGRLSQFNNLWKETVDGADQPIARSNRSIGENVKIIYNPEKYDDQAFEDTFIELWLLPIILLFLHILLFLLAFSKGRR